MGGHVVSPGGIECFPVLLLEVLSCPFPLYSVRVDGGEATCHRLTFFFFFFSLFYPKKYFNFNFYSFNF
jgi:hypothetical protein